MFKNQLQEYAQKAGLPVPVYDVTKEGPSHEPQFKASVNFRGEKYESSTLFANSKAAEHAAAEIALAALGKTEARQLHESGLLKTLLQEYAQKCKLPLPFYSPVKTGDVHSPMYNATVEIGGVLYDGGSCKTKKESEIKAARNALVAIYAGSSVSLLDGSKDLPAAGKPNSKVVEAMAEPESTLDEESASVERRVESKSAVEETATTAVVSIPQPNPANKRRKLRKGGKEVRKRLSLDKAAVPSILEQANGSPSMVSGAAQESDEDSHLGLPTALCTDNNGDSQEKKA